MRRNHRIPKQKRSKAATNDPRILPFHGHVQELRRRLFYVVTLLVVFGGVGFFFRAQLTEILLRPAASQQFIYTSPVGGFDFIFRISLYFGLALTVPVLIFNIFQYLSPLLPQRSNWLVLKGTAASYILAATGVAFGYFVSLPAALSFLLHQFGTDQIQALLSIQEYMSFVTIYLVGFALLFQIPLVMIFINRITPLPPSTLIKSQRYVIVGASILAAILTPTADIINMAIMAVPIIVMYQIGFILVLATNRRIAPVFTPQPERKTTRSSQPNMTQSLQIAESKQNINQFPLNHPYIIQ